jgi:hypothetical protein
VTGTRGKDGYEGQGVFLVLANAPADPWTTRDVPGDVFTRGLAPSTQTRCATPDKVGCDPRCDTHKHDKDKHTYGARRTCSWPTPQER